MNWAVTKRQNPSPGESWTWPRRNSDLLTGTLGQFRQAACEARREARRGVSAAPAEQGNHAIQTGAGAAFALGGCGLTLVLMQQLCKLEYGKMTESTLDAKNTLMNHGLNSYFLILSQA